MTPTPDDASQQLRLTKKLAVDEYRAWGLWLWLKQAAPNEYDRLDLEMQKKGVGPRSIENPGFVSVLLGLLPSLARHYDELNPKTAGPESIAGAVPVDVLSAAQSVIGDENRFRDELLRSFPRRLVAAYIRNLKKNQATASLVDDPQKEARLAVALRKATGAAAATISSDQLSPREAIDRLVSTIDPLIAESAAAQAALTSILERQQYLDEVGLLADSDRLFHSFQESATTMPIARIDIATKLLRAEIVSNPTAPVSASLERALSQARALELFGAQLVEDVANTPETRAALSYFFQAFAESGPERMIAPATDALLSFLPIQTRAQVIGLVVARSFEKTMNASAGGFKALQPEELSLLAASVHEQVARLLSASSLYQSTGGRFLTDRLTAVFGGPKAVLVSALESLAAHRGDFGRYFGPPLGPGGAPAQTHRGAYHAAAGSWGDAVSLFWMGSHDGAMFIIGRAFPRLLNSGWLGTDAMGLIFRWGSGRLVGVAARGAVGLAVRRVLGGIIGALLGRPVGLIVALVGPGILGKLKEKALGFIGGALAIVGLGGGKAKGFDSPMALAAAAVAIVIAVAFVGVFLTTTTIGSTFSTTYEARGGLTREDGDSDILRYAGLLPDTFSTIDRCPIATGFRITQTPYEAGSITHGHADAFDYAIAAGTPVFAAHDGFLVTRETRDGEKYCLSHPGGYGTYIRLVAKSEKGSFETRYAHLSDCARLALYNEKGEPNLITAGTTIGYVGNTGKSTGPHLHFELKGPGRLRGILPLSCGGIR